MSQSAFDAKAVDNYFSLGQRAICTNCAARGCSWQDTALYCCQGACGDQLGHKRFPLDSLRNFKRNASWELLCHTCHEAAKTKLERLKKLMTQSRRAACKCKRFEGHAESCPMHPRLAGERPYPGCDVMSREDAEWLQARTKRKRA